jgi:hypothetical protein
MSTFRLFAAAILASGVASSVLAQGEVISEPGYCAQFYPGANCQNTGPIAGMDRYAMGHRHHLLRLRERGSHSPAL